MTDSGYFVGQVADLLGSGKKKKKSDKGSSPSSELAVLFNVKPAKPATPSAVLTTPKQSKRKQPSAEESSKQSEVKTKPNEVKKPKKRKENKKDGKQEKKSVVEDKKGSENKISQGKEENNTVVKNDKKKKKKKKKKTNNNENDTGNSDDESEVSKKKKGFDPPKGIVHESLVKKDKSKEKTSGKRKRDEDSDDEENDETKSKRRKRHKRDKTKDKRTVFVGNIPIDCKKTAVKTLFAQFGKIESLRYRCPPVSDPKVSKKVTMIKKDFHPDRSNIVSFVCFENPEDAAKSLKLNGHNIDGFHLRVDLTCNEKKHNKANSVFVGNLPYDIEENDVWKHFEPCGTVENVRIVRDRKTGLGKGFGYVLFEERSAIDLAMKLHCSRLKQREIRVDKCGDSHKMKTPKNHPARQRLVKKAKKMGLKPTNLRPGEKRKPKTFKKDKTRKSKTNDSVNKAFAAPKPTSTGGGGANKHIKFD